MSTTTTTTPTKIKIIKYPHVNSDKFQEFLNDEKKLLLEHIIKNLSETYWIDKDKLESIKRKLGMNNKKIEIKDYQLPELKKLMTQHNLSKMGKKKVLLKRYDRFLNKNLLDTDLKKKRGRKRTKNIKKNL